MPDVIDTTSATKIKGHAPEDAREWRRMAERVKRDHATMRALLDDVERACRAVEEHRPDDRRRLRQAVWTLYVAFDEHLVTEEAYFAPILRTSDAWGDLRVVNMMVEHDEQRRLIRALLESADRAESEAWALVAQARALLASFRTDMDAEERSLDEAGFAPTVVSDQEDG